MTDMCTTCCGPPHPMTEAHCCYCVAPSESSTALRAAEGERAAILDYLRKRAVECGDPEGGDWLSIVADEIEQEKHAP